jgi:dihydropteroate synthase
VCIDPGIGFGKTLDHNLELLANLVDLATTGYPVLVGASRKSWIVHLLGEVPVPERDPLSAVAHALAIAGGASVVRVHDVAMGLRSARIADAIVRASGRGLNG